MRKIQLSGKKGEGKFALVDDEDYTRTNPYTWWINPDGYVIGYVDKIQIPLHRYILRDPKGRSIEFISKNRLDNRKENLRLCNKTYK